MLQKRTTLAALLALSVTLAACGESAGDVNGGEPIETPAPTKSATDTPQVEPTPTEIASEEAASDDSIVIAEHLREKTMRLWDVYNTHDPDALKIFYQEDYWKEQEEEIRENMQPFKNFGLTFTAEETSPPTEIAPGEWEVKHTARFPGGLLNMVFIYEEFGGDWLLTFAEPQ